MKDTLGAVETAVAMVVYVTMIKIRITRRVLGSFIIMLLVMMVMAVAVEMLVVMLVMMNRQGYSRWWRSLFILGSGILSLRRLLDFICPLIVSTRSSIRLLLLVVAAMARFRASSSSRSPAVTLAPAPKVSDGGDDDYNEGDSNSEANCC